MSGERQYDRCAYESYIRDLGEENSTLRAAFRTAFFEAMRSELTARQYPWSTRMGSPGFSFSKIRINSSR